MMAELMMKLSAIFFLSDMDCGLPYHSFVSSRNGKRKG
jgi:hypothetical protein